MISVTHRALLLPVLVALSTATSSMAQDPSSSLGDLANQGHSVTAVTPVYSQLVMFSFPPGFNESFLRAVCVPLG